MNLAPSALFFAKLRKLTVTLETETDKLRAAFENRNSDSDSESITRGMRAYNELNYEVINMKGQIQDLVTQQKAGMDEVSSFLKNYKVMQQKLSEDINILKGHWEKYGCQVPKNMETANQEALNENENQKLEEEEEEGNRGESGDESSFAKPVAPVADCLRTPQLCDFGLSEDQLKRALTGAERCSEVPPMPKMSLLHPSLNTPVPPFMAITPKRALQMDKDELLTPQMNDFGISEHTMCLNNDFTMALRQKHFGKHQKPQQNLEPPGNSLMESLKAKEEALNENQAPVEEEEVNHGESGDESSFAKPVAPVADCLRTPQLCDFGLSEDQLKRALTGAERCSEVPPMPKMSLLHPSLNTPVPPFMAITPKRALQMDKDELLTPQMNDFGISEHTMCLNNDFTMALRQKHFGKPQKPQQNPEPPGNSLMESLKANDSPEPPVFCTPGLKIKKTHVSTSAENIFDLESPSCPANMQPTPEVPAFQTPYMNHLISTKKSQRKPKPIKMQKPTPLQVPFASKCTWEYDVPDLLVEHMDDQIPEMPNLESNLGNSLQTRSAKMRKMVSDHEIPTFSPLDLDGLAQEFNLETPCARRVYEELSTPEMPDLSSVTQDICKLVSRAQLKKTANAVKRPHGGQKEKENTSTSLAATLPSVSEQEFHSLPSYLRQMTLNSLNQAIHNINSCIGKCQGDKLRFHTEELKQMIKCGPKTPLFILCLTELKRLDHIQGTRNNSVYKLNTQMGSSLRY